jgi:hypothetical protein
MKVTDSGKKKKLTFVLRRFQLGEEEDDDEAFI